MTNGTTTQYAGSYIYENGSLKFISHPEGYIEPDGGGGYSYVYQYKDFWKNVRLTYADDNSNGIVDNSEIRREQNYYPFGLEHKGYNGQMYGAKNNLKTFQGQEFHDELGLDITEFKYRFYDPSAGRFWSIDPLAEDYVYNSTYAFAENKLGMGIELEGLENHYNDLTSIVIMAGAELINKFTGGSKNAYEASTGDVIRNRLAASNPEFDAERARMERMEKLSNGLGNIANTASEIGHFSLDVLGASDIPVLSQLADGGNALWYLSEGNYVDASLSGFAILPVVGNAALGAKWSKNALKFADNGFVSKAGLFFGLGSKHGNRLSHLVAHTTNDLAKKIHGVFTVGSENLISTVDDAWAAIKEGNIQGITENGKNIYTVDMGKVVGYEGGYEGSGAALTKVKIVVKEGTSSVITAYPVK